MVYSYHAKKDGVYSVQFSADRDLLTVGYGDGAIEVSQKLSMAQVAEWPRHQTSNNGC